LILSGIWAFTASPATRHAEWIGCSDIQVRAKPFGALRQDGYASGSQPLLAAWRTTSTRLLNPSFSMARAL
jgi:hypothetical protein